MQKSAAKTESSIIYIYIYIFSFGCLHLSSDVLLYPEFLNSISNEVGLIGKLRHGDISPLKGGESSSASKTLEIFINKSHLLPYRICHDSVLVGDL